jgi:hypothetical protein
MAPLLAGNARGGGVSGEVLLTAHHLFGVVLEPEGSVGVNCSYGLNHTDGAATIQYFVQQNSLNS